MWVKWFLAVSIIINVLLLIPRKEYEEKANSLVLAALKRHGLPDSTMDITIRCKIDNNSEARCFVGRYCENMRGDVGKIMLFYYEGARGPIFYGNLKTYIYQDGEYEKRDLEPSDCFGD